MEFSRQNIAKLKQTDFHRLSTRNQLLVQNYLRLKEKILAKICDLQVGSPAELAVAIAMLDYYLSDLQTVSPPPIIR